MVVLSDHFDQYQYGSIYDRECCFIASAWRCVRASCVRCAAAARASGSFRARVRTRRRVRAGRAARRASASANRAAPAPPARGAPGSRAIRPESRAPPAPRTRAATAAVAAAGYAHITIAICVSACFRLSSSCVLYEFHLSNISL